MTHIPNATAISYMCKRESETDFTQNNDGFFFLIVSKTTVQSKQQCTETKNKPSIRYVSAIKVFPQALQHSEEIQRLNKILVL